MASFELQDGRFGRKAVSSGTKARFNLQTCVVQPNLQKMFSLTDCALLSLYVCFSKIAFRTAHLVMLALMAVGTIVFFLLRRKACREGGAYLRERKKDGCQTDILKQNGQTAPARRIYSFKGTLTRESKIVSLGLGEGG